MAAHQPSIEDVAEAMAMSFEREDAAGALWCPPNDASVLRRWITDRSRALGGGIRRVVRFARLARLADGRDYVRFIYLRIPTLRTRHFKQALQAAAAEGRLAPGIAHVGETGVRLKEPGMQVQAGPAGNGFEIEFVQMPRLAALVDVLHNALGYGAVADVLAPLLVAGTPAVHADDVARALHAKFNAWLSQRLGSLDHIRRARIIRAFLASRGRVAPEAIDDEAIISFWTAQVQGKDDDAEGFRLYRSAARALLRYRTALRDALAEAQIQTALPLGDEPGFADLERIEPAELTLNAWQSPLRLLAAPPANAVKWLNRKERLQLLNYLGGPHPDDDSDAAAHADANEAGPDTGLSGEERFDLGFVRTLLRADVFGAAQSSIVGRLRQRIAAPLAVEQALAPICDTAYDDCAADYAAVREQLRLESLAALVVLMEAGAAEALVLMRHFGGQGAIDAVATASRGNVVSLQPAGPSANRQDDGAFDPMIADELVRQLSSALSTTALRPDLLPDARDLIAQARAAARKVNRIGFRREDRSDPRVLLSLRSAVAAVVDLLHELDRLDSALSTAASRKEAGADRERFAAAFARIYCPGASGQ
jgi:hypothetical protein